jgi:protease I
MAQKPRDHFAASLADTKKSKGKSILILTASGTQDLEFFYPYYRYIEEGYQVDVVTPQGGEFKGKHDMGLKDTRAIRDVDASQYDMLYIPGGKAPEELKKDRDALALAQRFAEQGKPIASICHGAQVLAAAGLVQGYRIAAWPDVAKEVEDAGGRYTDEPTVIDGAFITARWPGDLPFHVAATLKVLQESAAKDKPFLRQATVR